MATVIKYSSLPLHQHSRILLKNGADVKVSGKKEEVVWGKSKRKIDILSSLENQVDSLSKLELPKRTFPNGTNLILKAGPFLSQCESTLLLKL